MNGQIVMRLNKNCVNENKNDWDECLDKILFSIRIQKQKSTKFSPFFLLFNRNAKVPVELSEDNDNVYMVDESMTVNEINGSGDHEWNVNSNFVNQFSKIEDNYIDINDSMNVMMYDSNNITKKFNNDSNVTQNERIIIDDFDVNDDVNRLMNKHIDQFVMVENKSRIKIKEIVNDNIQKAQEKYINDLKKKQTKSIKSYSFEIGMTVLKKNSRDSERKGGKLNAKWLGKYTITDIRGNCAKIKK